MIPNITVEDVIKEKNTVQNDMEGYRRVLMRANEYLVEELASKYVYFHSSVDDLRIIAYKGLIESAKRFDFNKGTPYSIYAEWWIKKRISEFILEKREE